jgi:hypothetical protein
MFAILALQAVMLEKVDVFKNENSEPCLKKKTS